MYVNGCFSLRIHSSSSSSTVKVSHLKMGLDPAHSAIEKGGDLPGGGGGEVAENEPGLTGCPTQLGGKGVQGTGTRTSIWASGL